MPTTATEPPQNPVPARTSAHEVVATQAEATTPQSPPADSDPPDAPGTADDPTAAEAAETPESPETPETMDEFIQSTVDAALSRLDTLLGVDAADPADLADGPDDDLDARAHLVAASTRAVERYFAERGVETGGAPLRITPPLLAEHGLPLATAVLGAIEAMMTTVLRDAYEGRKARPADKPAHLALDFTDLFDPPETEGEGSTGGKGAMGSTKGSK